MAEDLEITMEFTLRGPLADRVVMAAAKYNRAPADLMADVVSKALEDDLISAILDER